MTLPADFPPATRSGYVVLGGRKKAHILMPGWQTPVRPRAWCGQVGAVRPAPYDAQRCRVCEHNAAEAAKRKAVS